MAFEPKPFGKYFLMEKIAFGGMAEIYKAKTFGVDGFEKMLAIKKILPHYSSDREFISMLTDEAKLVVQLSHTNIVQVYDLGKVGDDYYISMEFIDGVNLREILYRAKELKEKLPLPICLFIASEICKGLDYAHSRKDASGKPLEIVHRDISPQNILVSFEGETKIADFGIAKAAQNVSETSSGTLKGKVTYMSPEQAVGKPIDPRADIFSVGLILYEMITGERFFTGESQFEVLKKIRETNITQEILSQKIPAEVVPVLAQALTYTQKNRYQSAGEFQIALTRLLYSRYHEFSPKQLSQLIHRLFAGEIKVRMAKQREGAKSQNMSHPAPLKKESVLAYNDSFINDTTKPDEAFKPKDLRHTDAIQIEQRSSNLDAIDQAALDEAITHSEVMAAFSSKSRMIYGVLIGVVLISTLIMVLWFVLSHKGN